MAVEGKYRTRVCYNCFCIIQRKAVAYPDFQFAFYCSKECLDSSLDKIECIGKVLDALLVPSIDPSFKGNQGTLVFLVHFLYYCQSENNIDSRIYLQQMLKLYHADNSSAALLAEKIVIILTTYASPEFLSFLEANQLLSSSSLKTFIEIIWFNGQRLDIPGTSNVCAMLL